MAAPFHKGDRVYALYNEYYGSYLNIRAGSTGTICCDAPEILSGKWRIRLDEKPLCIGHECGGNCDFGMGWNVAEDRIALILDDEGDSLLNSEDVDLSDLFGGASA